MGKSKKITSTTETELPRCGKCVLVGDRHIGKTCLVISYITKHFPQPEEYVPVIYDNCTQTEEVDGEPFELELLDTIGGEHRLRPLAYPKTDVLLLCFSITNPESFDSVLHQWKVELSFYCPCVPIILVGTKSDLRDDPDTIEKVKNKEVTLISHTEAEQLAEDINAICYVECSAMNQELLKDLFHTAIRSARNY